MNRRQNALRSCLLGLAVGDAMGHTVDNKSLSEIRTDYGPNGLLGYDLVNGYADVTSYTQLAAFTANGLLIGQTRLKLRGQNIPPIRCIAMAIREWSRSQQYSEREKNYCWLSTAPEMKRRQCMDTWMLSVLSSDRMGTPEEPVNRSDHPAALTTAIPIALLAQDLGLTGEERNRLAAETVALTHGSQETFLSGAVLAHILGQLLEEPDMELHDMIDDTIAAIGLQFGRDFPQAAKIWELFQLARTLAGSDSIAPADAMEQLGCKTGAEVLAGAIYAMLTCGNDFDAAMITAVNHSGRSAAVGAVTGALLGAKLGPDALPEFYLESLNCTETLTELTLDMLRCDSLTNIVNIFDDDWDRKYLHGGL